MKKNKNLRRKLKKKAIEEKGKWLHSKNEAIKWLDKFYDYKDYAYFWIWYKNACEERIRKLDERIKSL